MITISKVKRMLRGDVDARTFFREAVRRTRVSRARRREREQLAELAQPARLRETFARMTATELVAHFQSRATPEFFPGFISGSTTAELQRTLFPNETSQLLAQATRI